jgi:N-acetylglutamate synthase-like GNAT family acetyltransferase
MSKISLIWAIYNGIANEMESAERTKMRQDFSCEQESLISIRAAEPNDASGIHEVLKYAFLNLKVENYSRRAIEAAITKPCMIRERIISNQPILVATETARIIGTITGVIQHMSMKIESFAVHPDFQGRDIGKQLLQALEDIAIESGCYKVYLFTAWSMKNAAQLYYQLDYEKEGYLRNHFYGEDLVIFGKYLDDGGEFKWITSK